MIDMIETDGAVGCGCGAHVLEVIAGAFTEFGSDPLIETFDVGNIFHDLLSDGTAKQLRLRFL